MIVMKAMFTIWILMILAIMLSVVIGAWWIKRDEVLLWYIGFIIFMGVFLIRELNKRTS